MATETADTPPRDTPDTPPDDAGPGTPSAVTPGLSGCIGLFRETELTPERAIETLQLTESLIAWAQAQRAKVITVIDQQFHDQAQQTGNLLEWVDRDAVIRLNEDLAPGLAATEIACALRIPERTATALLHDSLALCRDYPATLEALQQGHLGYPQALTITDEASSLPQPARAGFETLLLGKASKLTNAQLTRTARREREKHHPDTIQTRRAKAVQDRRVAITPDQDGMCWLNAYLPAETGTGIHHLITNLARASQGPDEPRTLTQLRADVFTDLLTGRTPIPGTMSEDHLSAGTAPGGPASTTSPGTAADDESTASTTPRDAASHHTAAPNRTAGDADSRVTGRTGYGPSRFTGPEVLVTIDAATLAGITNHPANLEGYGPLSPDIARNLAALANTFTPLLTDSHGNLLAIGRRKRLPPTIIRRWLRARDETCRFPGCNRSAYNCEIDHTTPWTKTHDTHHTGLAHLCKKHHRYKTLTTWNVTQKPPGHLTWTSPTHQTYHTTPAINLTPQPPPF